MRSSRGLLIEVAWIALPMFDAPEWMLGTFIVFLALGFILAVTISWAFEMTPEGMKRTADVTPDEVLLIGANGSSRHSSPALRPLRLSCLPTNCGDSARCSKNGLRRNALIIFIQGNQAGTQTVEGQADGAMRTEYSYNDRGRGDHIMATWKLDGAGVPVEYERQRQ